MLSNEFLPEPLPASALPLFEQWFAEAHARAVQPNPNAMVLATVGDDRRPSARVLLCKQIVADPGYLVFFTNYESRKGRELIAHPRAAAVFHWDLMHRQVRIEGTVTKSPPEESDAYFSSRLLESCIGAWASRQSEPLASRATLEQQVNEITRRFTAPGSALPMDVPRPPHWGGFRLWIDCIELWVEGPGRVHDRAVWIRTLSKRSEDNFTFGEWQATRLNP